MADPQPDRVTEAPQGRPQEQTPTGDTRQPLRRNYNFLLLWSGQTVSTIGNRISNLAYPLLILTLTGSTAKAGIVGFALALPAPLWYLPAGALVDRWNPKRVMIVADAARAVAVASLVVAVLVGRPSLPHLVLVAFIEGTGAVFFQLADAAALPRIVTPHQLPAALAQNQARDQGAGLAGQPLGGLLFSLGHMVPFLANAVSYLASLCSLALIRLSAPQPRDRQPRHLLTEVAEGIVWLWRQPLLRALAALLALTNLAIGALPLILIVRARELGAAPVIIGLMMGAIGGGAVLGALTAPWLQRRLPERTILLGTLWTWTMLVAVLPALPDVAALGLVMALVTPLAPVVNVVVTNYRYALVPNRLLARVTSVSRLIALGLAPLASLAAGLIMARSGPAPAFVIAATVLGLAALAATATPVVRRAPSTQRLTTGTLESNRTDAPPGVRS